MTRGAPHHGGESRLPCEHIKTGNGTALCGATRRWGVLFSQRAIETNCNRCRQIQEREGAAAKSEKP